MEKEDQKLLELAICGYLPYGLKCHLMGMAEDDYADPIIPTIHKITGFLTDGSVVVDNGKYTPWELDEVFPILYPIEYLTKPITVEGYNDGKEFVPLIELAKLTMPHIRYCSTPNYADISYSDRIEVVFNIDNGQYFAFDLLKNSFVYGAISKNSKYMILPVINQVAMFDLLNQWHIDWRGLIAKGLAVDKTSTL